MHTHASPAYIGKFRGGEYKSKACACATSLYDYPRVPSTRIVIVARHQPSHFIIRQARVIFLAVHYVPRVIFFFFFLSHTYVENFREYWKIFLASLLAKSNLQLSGTFGALIRVTWAKRHNNFYNFLQSAPQWSRN